MSAPIQDHELRLEVGDPPVVLRDWTRAEITRSLTDLAAGFRLEYHDQDRMQAALPRTGERDGLIGVRPWMPARLYLDGELVLVGIIDDIDFEVSADQVRASMAGRDLTGQLVDCSAAPEGPAEYRGLTVTELAARLAEPFGIPVRAEVDVGAPLREVSVDLGETVHQVIDKAARQRAVLVTSDGVGGLVLTRSGGRKAPDTLRIPGNVVSFGSQLSGRERFSDYWVKGQTRHSRGGRRAALDGTAHPLPTRPAEGSATGTHSRRPVSAAGLDGTAHPLGAVVPRPAKPRDRPAVISTGYAIDPKVPLYRPRVLVSRAQSGGSPNQVLAEWRMRVARGKSTRNRWTVAGWHAGAEGRLWRPNELVAIEVGNGETYEQLIAGVAYSQSDREGSRTVLQVVGREAFDLEPLGDQHRRHGSRRVRRESDVANTGGDRRDK